MFISSTPYSPVYRLDVPSKRDGKYFNIANNFSQDDLNVDLFMYLLLGKGVDGNRE